LVKSARPTVLQALLLLAQEARPLLGRRRTEALQPLLCLVGLAGRIVQRLLHQLDADQRGEGDVKRAERGRDPGDACPEPPEAATSPLQ
jgi:hypothetical protein